MLAELVLRENAARAILAFCLVVGGICVVYLWFLWWTLWECRHCSRVMRDCRCCSLCGKTSHDPEHKPWCVKHRRSP